MVNRIRKHVNLQRHSITVLIQQNLGLGVKMEPSVHRWNLDLLER